MAAGRSVATGEVVSPGVLTRAVSAVFVLSMVAAVAYLLSATPKVKPKHLAGTRTASLPHGLVSAATQRVALEMEVGDHGTGFTLDHPLGRVQGFIRIEGRTLKLGFDNIGGVSHYEWGKNWPKRRLELLREARRHAHTVAADHPLAAVLNAPSESEALRLLKQHHAEDAVDPFGGTWQYEVLRGGEWRSLFDGQPDFVKTAGTIHPAATSGVP